MEHPAHLRVCRNSGESPTFPNGREMWATYQKMGGREMQVLPLRSAAPRSGRDDKGVGRGMQEKPRPAKEGWTGTRHFPTLVK